MITYKKGDLLKSNCDIICHQVNLQGLFGGGLAYQIYCKYPKVETNLLKALNKDYAKIVYKHRYDIQFADFKNNKPQYIANIFSQDEYFNTNYEWLDEALTNMFKHIKKIDSCLNLKNLEGQTWWVKRNAINAPRFREGDVIEAVDNEYPITSKENKWKGIVEKGYRWCGVYNVKAVTTEDNSGHIGDSYLLEDTHFEKVNVMKVEEKKKRKPRAEIKKKKKIKVFSIDKFCEEESECAENFDENTWQFACDMCVVENNKCLGVDGFTYKIEDCWTVEIEEDE